MAIVAEAMRPHRCLQALLPTCTAAIFKLNFPDAFFPVQPWVPGAVGRLFVFPKFL